MKERNKKHEHGSILLGVLLLLSLGLLISVGMLSSASSNTKTRALVKTRADYYYDVEATLNKTVAWLQTNSKSLVTAFMGANFETNFDLGSPAVGDNEGQFFTVPTMVKMKGTNSSVMLSNNAFFGESAFPSSTHIDTNASFDAVSEFESADLGAANARVVLIWARETDGNYEPIFRVDVVTGNNPDRGVHSFSYIYSTLVATEGALGFYGQQFMTLQSPNNECYSYQYSYDAGAGTWSRGAPRANCPIGSNGPINISSHVHGTAKTLLDDGIILNPPGGNVSGSPCDGPNCHSYSLPSMSDWATYCPGVVNDIEVIADTELAAAGCYRDIGIDNDKTLTLSNYEDPYYIRTLDFRSNFAKFALGSIPPGEVVTVFVETISNNHINGNLFYNPNNAPHQLVINYIGLNAISLDGTADINAVVVAPNSTVTVNGNFNFYGGIYTTQLTILGRARINWDEGIGGIPVLSDMNFALRKASQRYR